MTEPTLRALSLGAGVQSTTLLLMSLAGELPRLDVALFADTGWEPQAVYRHLEWLEGVCQAAGLALVRVTAGSLPEAVLASSRTGSWAANPPLFVRSAGSDRGGRLWRQCTRDYKIAPQHQELRRRLGVPRGRPVPNGVIVEQWIGISLDELQRMKPAREAWVRTRFPLIERRMTRQDCLAWLAKQGYPRPPKSSCLGCPYHSDRHWQEMAQEAPEEFAQVVAFEQELQRGKLPGVHGTPYLHRALRPLREAVEAQLAQTADQGAFAFLDECSGVCFS